MSSRYGTLKRAKLVKEYLKTNSTTHQFLFGAMAELVDNSRDAKAKNLHIFTQHRPDLRGDYVLCFADDGTGMDPMETADVIQFGKSLKKNTNEELIGQYGNGLKSGSQRIGSELLVFTKKNNILTILMISHTFFETEKIEEIIVPLPSFYDKTFEPWFDVSNIDRTQAQEQHKTELEIILKYSPFKTRDELLENFNYIEYSSGTLIMVYNLILGNDGLSELDFETDAHDILMRHMRVDFSDKKAQLEHKSFREYVSVLYLNPKMQIYIQKKKVLTKLMDRNILCPIKYQYSSKIFKKKANDTIKNAENKIAQARAEIKEANSNFEHAKKEYEKNMKTKFKENLLADLRLKKNAAQEMLTKQQKELEKLKKNVDSLKTLEFIYGVNVDNRNADGFFIYNCNRLIIMFEPSKQQTKLNKDYRGVVGIVNVPYFLSNPTHNKQSFENSSEEKALIGAMSEYMDHYVRDYKPVFDADFWRTFGYVSSGYDKPLRDNIYLKARLIKIKLLLQCSQCEKWREQEFHANMLNPDFKKNDDWSCDKMPTKYSCMRPEKLEPIESGLIKKRKQFDDWGTELDTNNERESSGSSTYKKSIAFANRLAANSSFSLKRRLDERDENSNDQSNSVDSFDTTSINLIRKTNPTKQALKENSERENAMLASKKLPQDNYRISAASFALNNVLQKYKDLLLMMCEMNNDAEMILKISSVSREELLNNPVLDYINRAKEKTRSSFNETVRNEKEAIFREVKEKIYENIEDINVAKNIFKCLKSELKAEKNKKPISTEIK